MLGFDALAGAPLAAGPTWPSAPPPPADELDGAVILLVPARCALAVVEARATTIAVPARPVILEVRRAR